MLIELLSVCATVSFDWSLASNSQGHKQSTILY